MPLQLTDTSKCPTTPVILQNNLGACHYSKRCGFVKCLCFMSNTRLFYFTPAVNDFITNKIIYLHQNLINFLEHTRLDWRCTYPNVDTRTSKSFV